MNNWDDYRGRWIAIAGKKVLAVADAVEKLRTLVDVPCMFVKVPEYPDTSEDKSIDDFWRLDD